MTLPLIGDIANWLAAGIIFPLMLMPLAIHFGSASRPTISWVILVSVFTAAGLLFAWLVPVITATASPQALLIFAGTMLAVALCVGLTGGAEHFVNLLSPLFSSITRITAQTVMWLLLAMAFIQFSVVVMRYVFGINYIFMQESITYLHGTIFLLAAGYALITDDHVRVDIFYRGATEKKKALIDFLGTYLFLFPVCLLLLWTASPYVGNSWAVGEGSAETSGIQAVFLLKSLIPAFAILLAMAGFSIAARAGGVLKGTP